MSDGEVVQLRRLPLSLLLCVCVSPSLSRYEVRADGQLCTVPAATSLPLTQVSNDQLISTSSPISHTLSMTGFPLLLSDFALQLDPFEYYN